MNLKSFTPNTRLWLLPLLVVLTSCSSSNHNQTAQYDSYKAKTIVKVAKQMIGKPYRYGGSSPLEGFDCSGLVMYSHQQVSSGIPRVSIKQYQAAVSVKMSELKPGDVLFYKTGSTPTHSAIYIGKRQFIHAPSSGKKVKIGSMDNPYFKKRLVKAGRLY